VNEIAPAMLMTEMVKGYFEWPDAVPFGNVIARLALDHVGRPEDAAGAVPFLCSERASFFTGSTLPIDGGFVLYNAGSYWRCPLPMADARSRWDTPQQPW
jgi:NAD(P)-dependent dehydrogenase (short-subunit alcohol dehydrogenase family)